ncbi:MAG: DsbA family protein [Patulibacter minatonensis]
MTDASTPRPLFLVDLGSPYAYLAAERISDVVGEADWQAVLLGGIFRATGRSSWAQTDRRADGHAEIERRALERGLPPIAWPDPWPSDGLLAARAATWADRQGAGRAFITEALRMHFRDGRTLSDPDVVREVGTRVGFAAAELVAGAAEPATKALLRARTELALARGVFGVPAVLFAPFVFWGDDQLEQAATVLRAVGGAAAGRSAAAGSDGSPGEERA